MSSSRIVSVDSRVLPVCNDTRLQRCADECFSLRNDDTALTLATESLGLPE